MNFPFESSHHLQVAIEGWGNFLPQRETEFTNNFCRKLICYALGRTIILADKPLLDSMRTNLAKPDDRFSVAEK